MAAANPPQELKIKTPEKDYQDPGPAEDRILSPEETENFFRTGSIDDPNAPEDDEEREQSQMAGDFFSGIPVDSVQPGQAPVKPREPSQDQLTQMVQHDQSIEQQVQQQIQGQGQAQPPGVQPQGQSQTQPPAAIPSPQEAALQAQVQQLGQQVQHLTQLLAQQAARTPEPQGQGSQSQSPQFNLQVPPQYLEAIGSDDPVLRAQALNGLLNGVAQTVHAQTIKDVETRLQTLTPQVQRQVQEAQSQAEIKRDMYGTYPELNGMQDMVVAAASQLQAQFPGGWSQDYRDAIAERLAPLVPGLSQRVQQNRAQRGQVYNQPQYAQYGQQVLPQVQQPQGLPAGVSPQQIQGGVHVQAGNPQPILVRDAQGNISQVYPQHQQQVAGGAQSRPNGAGVDPALQDIWSTLGFA